MDAWHALLKAVRALRKEGDIRYRLTEAYRVLAKLRSKDLPHEVRSDYEWLQSHLHPGDVDGLLTEIRTAVSQLSAAQLSEAVHRIATLYEAVEQYQPPTASTTSKRAACSAAKNTERVGAKQLDLWET
jgi:hypothetical protein